MHTDRTICTHTHKEEWANEDRVTHAAQGNEELIYSMCVNIKAAKALFLEIFGTNSLCHITSWLNTLTNLLLWLCSILLCGHWHKKKSPHTSTENLFFPQLIPCTSLPSAEINKIRWLRILFMNEVKTRGVMIPRFQVANTRLSMALFVSLKCNKSISIYESPSL